ncbi:MAG: hypothetical protein VWZ99_03900, partial [Aquiluna sp.]
MASMTSQRSEKLAKQSRLLSSFNNAVLAVAVVVYGAILYSAVLGGELFAFVPLTSVLLGVLLIHFSVRVLLSHLALIREVA